ncbi:hypothetical protein ACHQM5_020445 [Ranunculus cassubicifolius]
MSISANNFVGESDDDSETNINSDGDDYYQPISAVDDSTSDREEGEEHIFNESNGGNSVNSIPSLGSPNNCHDLGLSNGHTRGMNFNEEETEDGETSEAEEEERRREAIRRAFREDETRRNARLPRENATRIMNAMREISFGGFTPVWADQVPEHQWINQLERLRLQAPTLSAANQEN